LGEEECTSGRRLNISVAATSAMEVASDRKHLMRYFVLVAGWSSKVPKEALSQMVCVT